MLKWRLIAAGNYESVDGRWTLTVDPLKRKEWTLYDRSRKDPVVPEYQWMTRVQSLSHGKNVAERELRKERTNLKARVQLALTLLPKTADTVVLIQLLQDVEKAL